jgi:transcriptional regulator with XRE-family HTH domain
VDGANILLTEEPSEGHLAGMSQPHKRPPPQPHLGELIALRQRRFPNLMVRDFAAMLGVTRLHLTNVERGRRRPSADLVLRWLALLAPEARLSMFGDLPVIEERIRALKKLQQVSPKAA